MASESVPKLCGPCRREQYAFDLARSYGLYSQILRGAILQLKFHRRERLGRKLGTLLARVWDPIAQGGNPPLLVPVPLHPARQRERGFNQSELLAQGLRQQLKRDDQWPAPGLDTRCLRRVQPTVPQITLGDRARWENVRRVFIADPGRVRERDVVLVDDVMTTGATVSACARALKRAGAQVVMVVTLARATPQFPDGIGITAHSG